MASGVLSVVNWFQRTVPWSNTPRAWLERGVLFGVVLAATVLILYSYLLPPWLTVVAWGALLVLFGFLLRQGWLFVFGPVLVYDLVRSARRTRTYVVRLLYLLILFIAVLWVYWAEMSDRGWRPLTAQDQARSSQVIFVVFLSTQLALVVLLTPVYVAGSISEEKERNTIEYILATDLRNREIVLGKFVSRLLHLSMLVLAGLPILSAMQFMGGIDPNLLLAGFAGTGLTMLSIAGISMFASAISRKTRDAIILVYVVMLVYIGLWGVGTALLNAVTGPTGSRGFIGDVLFGFVYVLRLGNPGYAIFQIVGSGAVTGTLVWGILGDYALFHGILGGVSLLGAIALLRSSALAQPKPRKGRTLLGLGWKRRLPRVGSHPMIWKEVFAERGFRPHILLRILFYLLVLLSFVPLFFIVVEFFFGSRNVYYGYGSSSPWDHLGREVNHNFVRPVGMLVGVFSLLAVGIRAATSVRSEYQKDTFDALLTSPMSSEEILFGKWLGSVLSVRWQALWLLAIWMIGIVTGAINLFMFPLLIASWLIYAALAASLGLWFSVTRKTSLWAMVATLCTFFVITLGHWLPTICCATFAGGPRGLNDFFETLMQIQLGLTPEAVLAFLPFRTEELTENVSNNRWIPIKLIIFAMGGTFCWGIVAWGLWQATNERFKRLTFRGHSTAADKLRRVLPANPRREQ